MNCKLILLFILLLNQSILGQEYTVNEQKSKITFAIKNLGIKVNGFFTGLQGNLNYNANNLNEFKIKVSVNSNSVNTDNKSRDKHLREEDYFHVEKFPLITFEASKIETSKRINRFNIEGKLTIKGISKPIKLELVAIEKENNLELKCNFDVNRRHFKVGGSSLVLSDNVLINITINANK